MCRCSITPCTASPATAPSGAPATVLRSSAPSTTARLPLPTPPSHASSTPGEKASWTPTWFL
eukprot:4030214-Prymnesium_polylepis.1